MRSRKLTIKKVKSKRKVNQMVTRKRTLSLMTRREMIKNNLIQTKIKKRREKMISLKIKMQLHWKPSKIKILTRR